MPSSDHTRGIHLKKLSIGARQLQLTITRDPNSSRQIIVTDRFGDKIGELNFHRGCITSMLLHGHHFNFSTPGFSPYEAVESVLLELSKSAKGSGIGKPLQQVRP